MHSLVQEPGAEEDIPFLLVRESDWRGVAGQLLALQVLYCYCTVLYCTVLYCYCTVLCSPCSET